MNPNNYISKKYLKTLKKELMIKIRNTNNSELKHEYFNQIKFIYRLLKINESEETNE